VTGLAWGWHSARSDTPVTVNPAKPKQPPKLCTSLSIKTIWLPFSMKNGTFPYDIKGGKALNDNKN
jgi:hypothetical protein